MSTIEAISISAEVPQPSEPATPVVPDAPVTPIDPDPGSPAAPELPAEVPAPGEPSTPIVPGEPAPAEPDSRADGRHPEPRRRHPEPRRRGTDLGVRVRRGPRVEDQRAPGAASQGSQSTGNPLSAG